MKRKLEMPASVRWPPKEWCRQTEQPVTELGVKWTLKDLRESIAVQMREAVKGLIVEAVAKELVDKALVPLSVEAESERDVSLHATEYVALVDSLWWPYAVPNLLRFYKALCEVKQTLESHKLPRVYLQDMLEEVKATLPPLIDC